MKSIKVPELDHDKFMLEKYGHKLNPRMILERRIVANLLHHLEINKFSVLIVDDGEMINSVSSIKDAMEIAFNLDECWFRVKNNHWIYLVFGNGEPCMDMICDWGYSLNDKDGFNSIMEKFNAEDFA